MELLTDDIRAMRRALHAPRLPRPGRRGARRAGPGRPARPASGSVGGPSDRAGAASIPPLHFPPRAKRVIHLYMAGGPSHLETFDYKPKLAEMHGQPMPESFTKGQPIAQLQGQQLTLLRARSIPFQKLRQVRARRSRTLFPHIGVDRRRHLHRPLDADRADQPRPGPHLHEHRHARSPAGRAWARGSGTASAARPTTCPASSC